MRRALLVFCCACASSAPVLPASEAAPEGSHIELIRGRAAPGTIAALDEEVRRLTTLARRSGDSWPILLRLADALMERAAAHGLEELRALEAAFARRSEGAAHGGARARGERHAEERIADLTRARRVLEAIPAEASESARARETLFWLLAERREWQADSLAAARAILETDRTGSLVAAAHLRLAEAAFLDARLEVALVHYDAVLATEGADPQGAAFASYKRAWVLTNLQRFREADRAFARTLELARGQEHGAALVREAAKDRLRLHVTLRSPPADVLAIIEQSTDDAAFRATLARRFERLLRDAGQLAEAEAFRALVLR